MSKQKKPRPPDFVKPRDKIFKIRYDPKEDIEGYTFRNVTMLSKKNQPMLAVTFYHPVRLPTFEEIRIMLDTIYPNRNLFIPVRMHTVSSKMISAIEFPTSEQPAKPDAPENPVPQADGLGIDKIK